MIKDRDSWETPKELWNKLNEQYNFWIDCCANKSNHKCNRYYEIFEDCDFIHDNLVCWMNPPFSKAYTMFEHFFKVINKGVAIYRCDNMETKVWQKIILPNSSWIFIFNKRIQYEGQEGKGSRFPSALFGFNVPPPKLTNGVLLI
jgi:site-specific DNA-methyltransferase (adenine-specific)